MDGNVFIFLLKYIRFQMYFQIFKLALNVTNIPLRH